MSVKKTSLGYQVAYYDADGRLRRQTYRGIDRKEAEKLERALLAERDVGKRPIDEKNAPTFRSFAEVWMQEARGRKGPWTISTKSQYRSALDVHLLPAFGDLRVSHIREEKVSAFMAGLQDKKLSVRRTNLRLTTLKTILKRARRRRHVGEDYLLDVHLLDVPAAPVDPMPPEDIAAFLAACPSWWKAYFKVAFYTGLRPGEAAALKWGDVDWQHSTFRIRAAVYRWVEGDPKTRSGIRDVDMLPPVVEAYKAQKAQQAAQRLRSGQGAPEVGKDYVFTGPDGGMFNINFVRDTVWYPTLKKSGLRRRVMYQTRHSFASNSLAAGESPTWVAAQLGHKGAAILFSTYAKHIPNRSRHDGTAFTARMEGDGQPGVISGRQTAESGS